VPSPKRVDFYILETAEAAGRLSFACRLTEKAYGANTHVYAHTESAAEAQRFDDLLWTFRQGSFIPHQLLTENPQQRAPVSIGTGTSRPDQGQLLINLTDELPDFTDGFERIAEIVCANETSRQAGRERFKQYRDMGLKPDTHEIARA
jgi:DNA polymerase-3 subunit chi